jgi:lysozyme
MTDATEGAACGAATEFIAKWEGFSPTPFLDSDGVWRIGYGYSTLANGNRVEEATPPITEAAAHQRLSELVANVLDCVIFLAEVDLNPNQQAALVSFAYNVGIYGLHRSRLLASINKEDFSKISEEFGEWNLVNGIENPGLTARRAAEAKLFLTPPAAPAAPQAPDQENV